jgi:hypothetical protein
VARDDVAQLVGQHRGEFGLGIELEEDADGEEDLTVRQGESVGVGSAQHVDGQRQLPGQVVGDQRAEHSRVVLVDERVGKNQPRGTQFLGGGQRERMQFLLVGCGLGRRGRRNRQREDTGKCGSALHEVVDANGPYICSAR